MLPMAPSRTASSHTPFEVFIAYLPCLIAVSWAGRAAIVLFVLQKQKPQNISHTQFDCGIRWELIVFHASSMTLKSQFSRKPHTAHVAWRIMAKPLAFSFFSSICCDFGEEVNLIFWL